MSAACKATSPASARDEALTHVDAAADLVSRIARHLDRASELDPVICARLNAFAVLDEINAGLASALDRVVDELGGRA